MANATSGRSDFKKFKEKQIRIQSTEKIQETGKEAHLPHHLGSALDVKLHGQLDVEDQS